MSWNIVFFLNSILLGIGLAMDAFSVSVANGLAEQEMKKGKQNLIAGTFGFFQAFMPMLGWVCVHTIVEHFRSFDKFIPWIALILLLYIGGNMLIESISNIRKGMEGEEVSLTKVSFAALMVQGIATSIDALSVGFTIAGYGWLMALVCALIIAVVTYFISLGGLYIGRTVGTRLSNKAGILGGCILIFIGLEIFITGIL
ncbi:MAG: manganese efflux pump MntP family protein [Eubacteriales bacterium]|nr:manganese efflux pump MntP family protein [Eubacteriales bacterium]